MLPQMMPMPWTMIMMTMMITFYSIMQILSTSKESIYKKKNYMKTMKKTSKWYEKMTKC